MTESDPEQSLRLRRSTGIPALPTVKIVGHVSRI
jgi:hypothetical protein